MSTKELLEELIDTSPIIAEHYSNMEFGDPESYSALTLPDLIIRGFSVLVDLLEEQGIVFSVEFQELVSDFYNARFLIYVYKTFSPIFLEVRLNNDYDLYNKITALLDGVSRTEFLPTIMEFFARREPSQFNTAMQVFLFDKIHNSQLYGDAIIIMLDTTELCHTTLDADPEVTAFLSILYQERIQCKITILEIASQLNLDIGKLEILSTSFRLDMISKDLAFIHTSHKSGVDMANNILMKCLEGVKSKSKFYIESYKDTTKLDKEMILMMILTQISDFRLFGIVPDYDPLKHISVEYGEFVTRILGMIKK